MSSLGDLLLAHLKPNKTEDSSNDVEPTVAPKVFPGRVAKSNIEETQSNASSTDDYVRELLDPDDRPRNVWHVVEGPKVNSETEERSQDESGHIDDKEHIHSEDRDRSRMEDEEPAHIDDKEPSSRTEDKDRDRFDSRHSSSRHRSSRRRHQHSHDDDEGNSDVDRRRRRDRRRSHSRSKASSSSRRRERSPTDDYVRELLDPDDRSRNVKHAVEGSKINPEPEERPREKERGRAEDKDRVRTEDRDRDRYDSRHSSSRHRSSRRRHQYSHDDDDDSDVDRRRRRDRRRSHSRSKVSSSSRRRERSRSDSQSPTTKRNSRTILIMQLNPRADSHDLEEFFSDIGKVKEVRLIMDSKTRKHKGIAYIEFEDASSAQRAMSLNGKEFFDSNIVIQSAQTDRNNRSLGDWHSSSTSQTVNQASSSHPSSRSTLPPNCYRVYVGGLHMNLTEDMLRSVFEPFGPIVRLELMRDRATNVSRGYAFITYAYIEDGQNAVQCLDGLELAGKSIRVSKSTDKNDRNMSKDGGATSSSRGGGHHHDSDSDGRSSRSKDVTASLYELAGH